jgi:hypothetical protein
VTTPETIGAAYDAGINFFFLSADMHWPLYDASRRGIEQLLARGGGIREQIVIAAASYATQNEFCHAPFLELVEFTRGLERIDVLVAGGSYAPEIDRRAAVYAESRTRAFAGARAIGASFHDRPAAAAHACAGVFDVCFSRYSPCHPGAEKDLFPHVSERRALLYNFNSTFGHVPPKRCDELGLGPELWRPDITDYYRFALTPGEVDGFLCSPHIPAHLEALARAIDRGPLDEEECQYLRSLSLLDEGLAEVVHDPGP